MDNRQLISQFYLCFSVGNAEGMADCYADDVIFEDPAFGILKGNDVKNMWRMLLKNPGTTITAANLNADEHKGRADWVATYTFSLTGNKVINNVHAEFEFKDGKISKHTDHFDFYKWAKQAFGLTGLLIGWTSFMKNKIRKKALNRLSKFDPVK
jgi:ketosteroid isomerase-like protein